MKKMLKKITLTGFVMGVIVLGSGLNAGDTKMPNMKEGVKVGDWVLVRVEGGIQMKQTVEEVTSEHLTIKTETIMDGATIFTSSNKTSTTDDYDAAPADGSQKPKFSKGKISVKGKEVECWIYEKITPEGKKLLAYFSREVPVNGMVKSELDGVTTLELIDFGRKK